MVGGREKVQKIVVFFFLSNTGADMSGRASDPPSVTSATGLENPCPRRKSSR